MLMVASELATGCILTPEIGAMYGPNNTSEAAQSERIVDRLPGNALVLADCGFGIFRVAYRCHSPGKEFVFRLTSDRIRKGLRSWKVARDSARGDSSGAHP